MASPRAWSFLTVDGSRQYGGNAGYPDEPERSYSYDSDVGNHLNVLLGDVAVIRSKARVIGIAAVESVVESPKEKERLRCPECGISNIKERKKLSPSWSCKAGHLFAAPRSEIVSVRGYEARYARTFLPLNGQLTTEQLQAAVLRPSDQMSIKEIDLAMIESFLSQEGLDNTIFVRFAQALEPADTPESVDVPGLNSLIEHRRIVLRQIAVRRGQTAFRKRLLDRYGARCQISGCSYEGLLEAAHIQPYSRSNDNGIGNGLLLRADLHTLFDLCLIGIDPATRRVSVLPELATAGYQDLQGVVLFENGTTGPGVAALGEHWLAHQEKLKAAREAI